MNNNRFKELGAAFKKDRTSEDKGTLVEENSSAEATVRKKRRQAGKRSNPDYEQIGAYIPKSLHLAVKKRLLEEQGLDFSDLVKELLEEWVGRT